MLLDELNIKGGWVKENAFVAMLLFVCEGGGGERLRKVNIIDVCGLC